MEWIKQPIGTMDVSQVTAEVSANAPSTNGETLSLKRAERLEPADGVELSEASRPDTT